MALLPGSSSRITRRGFVAIGGSALAAGLLAACGGAPAAPTPAPTQAPAAAAPAAPAAPTNTPAPAPAAAAPTNTPAPAPAAPTATTAPAAAATNTPAPAATGKLKDVPRNRTVVTVRGGTNAKFTEDQLWNPFIPSANHQLGSQFVCEPLAFYSAYQNKLIMWLAKSYEYSPDYMQLTIKTQPDAMWSDGVPFTADDVQYTFDQCLKLGAKIKWATNVQQVVKTVTTVDPTTVRFDFSVPAPRFMEFIAYKYDIGVYIMPKHIFEKQDMSTFPHLDIAKGWPVTTSPWRVVAASPDQKVLDRADSWWGEKAGIGKLPQALRIVYLPDPGEQNLAQGMIANNFDIVTGIQPTTFPTVFAGNAKVTTWTGQKAPFGYMDWWPHSLYVNTKTGPTADPDVRWAISQYIDRAQMIDVAWAGAATPAKLPMPDYPGLAPYLDNVKDLLAKYDTQEFNPKKADATLTNKGFKKGADGIWANAAGQKIDLPMISFFDFTSTGPVLVEQFKRAGISASYNEPPDMFAKFSSGEYTAALFGHGGSYSADPWYTLNLYQSSSQAIPGGHLVNFSLWKNDQFDKLADQMYGTSPTEVDKMMSIWHKAMELWLPALPDIMLDQGYHRLPTNTTYWTGWPDAQNPYVNSAFFHLTPGYIMHQLQPTQ
jgi:peptide/nickel transport system substrate-binding protein